jgi:hypothetical protein
MIAHFFIGSRMPNPEIVLANPTDISVEFERAWKNMEARAGAIPYVLNTRARTALLWAIIADFSVEIASYYTVTGIRAYTGGAPIFIDKALPPIPAWADTLIRSSITGGTINGNATMPWQNAEASTEAIMAFSDDISGRKLVPAFTHSSKDKLWYKDKTELAKFALCLFLAFLASMRSFGEAVTLNPANGNATLDLIKITLNVSLTTKLGLWSTMDLVNVFEKELSYFKKEKALIPHSAANLKARYLRKLKELHARGAYLPRSEFKNNHDKRSALNERIRLVADVKLPRDKNAVTRENLRALIKLVSFQQTQLDYLTHINEQTYPKLFQAKRLEITEASSLEDLQKKLAYQLAVHDKPSSIDAFSHHFATYHSALLMGSQDFNDLIAKEKLAIFVDQLMMLPDLDTLDAKTQSAIDRVMNAKLNFFKHHLTRYIAMILLLISSVSNWTNAHRGVLALLSGIEHIPILHAILDYIFWFSAMLVIAAIAMRFTLNAGRAMLPTSLPFVGWQANSFLCKAFLFPMSGLNLLSWGVSLEAATKAAATLGFGSVFTGLIPSISVLNNILVTVLGVLGLVAFYYLLFAGDGPRSSYVKTTKFFEDTSSYYSGFSAEQLVEELQTWHKVNPEKTEAFLSKVDETFFEEIVNFDLSKAPGKNASEEASSSEASSSKLCCFKFNPFGKDKGKGKLKEDIETGRFTNKVQPAEYSDGSDEETAPMLKKQKPGSSSRYGGVIN